MDVSKEPIHRHHAQCVQCNSAITNQHELGHCPQCEYFNEINDLKLCKNCIVTCQFCEQELCINCMNMYHEPCEQWRACQKCHYEMSFDDVPCEDCETEDFCNDCQPKCHMCHKTVCDTCHQRNSSDGGNVRTCLACRIQLNQNCMESDWEVWLWHISTQIAIGRDRESILESSVQVTNNYRNEIILTFGLAGDNNNIHYWIWR